MKDEGKGGTDAGGHGLSIGLRLLRLARRLFVLETADAARIVIGTSQSRQAYFPEPTRDRAAG